MSPRRFHPSLTPHHAHYRSSCDYTSVFERELERKKKREEEETSKVSVGKHELILKRNNERVEKLVEENVFLCIADSLWPDV